jgi:UDPglucose 6-dehydrogenase
MKTGNDFGSPVEIVETVIRANERHKQMMVRKIRSALGGSLEGRRLGVLGLSFKANTDDMRDAPSLTILPQLIADGATIQAYDPIAATQARMMLPDISLADSIEATIAGADAAIILTEWSRFRSIDWHSLLPTMRRPLIIDLRNIYEPEEMDELGVEYLPLGRRSRKVPMEAAAE